jgi:Tfp pilus assembly protein PilN
MSQQINLFNPIFLKQEKQFSALTMVQALGIILACAIMLTLYTRYQLSNLTTEQQATAAQLQLAQNQLAKVTAEYGPRQKDPAMASRLRRAELEVKSLQQISAVLGEGDFGNTAGYSAYLSAFASQITNGIWLTGFTIQGAGGDVSIQGSALRPESVPAFLSRLKNEPVMQGASFAALEMQLPKPVEDKSAASVEKKVMVQPAYVNFNLRSSVASKSESLSGAASQ